MNCLFKDIKKFQYINNHWLNKTNNIINTSNIIKLNNLYKNTKKFYDVSKSFHDHLKK
jgi:hypothetical protein